MASNDSSLFQLASQTVIQLSFFSEEDLLALKRDLYFSSLLKRATYISSILRAVTLIRSPLEAASCFFQSFQFFQSSSLHQLACEEGSPLQLAGRKRSLFQVVPDDGSLFHLTSKLGWLLQLGSVESPHSFPAVSPRRISCFELPAKRDFCFISRPKRSPFISSTLQSPTRISLPLEAASCISLTQSCSHCISSPLRRASSFTWPGLLQVASKCSLLGSKEGFLLQLTTS